MNQNQTTRSHTTRRITNSFTRILNIEKKNQAIRDDLLEFNGMMPSFTRQNENCRTVIPEENEDSTR